MNSLIMYVSTKYLVFITRSGRQSDLSPSNDKELIMILEQPRNQPICQESVAD